MRWRLYALRLLLPIAQTDITPVVHTEWRLDKHIVSHMAQQLFQFNVSVRRNGVEVRFGVFREGVVILVAPAAGFEAGIVELWRESIVTTKERRSVSTHSLDHGSRPHTYSIPEIILSYCSPLGMWLSWRARANCSGSFCWAAIVM